LRSRRRFSSAMAARYATHEAPDRQMNEMQMMYPGRYSGASFCRKE